jgi:phospholipid/cholesterol/gamma-HCH transport system substrate-binding protein
VRNPLAGVLHKSFLERNAVVIGAIGIAAVLGGSAFALLVSGGAFANTYSVSANFTDAAGIRPGDDVTVAGVDAGSVGDVAIEGDHVVVELKINHDVKMPADSQAEIVVETLLGKKSVNLTAGRSSDLLSEGDEIPINSTTTPVEVTDLSDASVTLMERSDAQALNKLMREVTLITKGKSNQLRMVIDGLAQVSQALASKRDELAGLIDSLDTLATTFAQKDRTIISIIDRYNVVLGNLAHRRDDLVTLLRNTDETSHQVASLVTRNRPALDNTLRDLHLALDVVNNHQLDLAAAIPYLDKSVRGYSSVGYSHGVPNRWANIFVQSLGPVGVDAIFGPCGLFDNALDEFLGPDPRSCEDRAQQGEEPRGSSKPDQKTSGSPDAGGGKTHGGSASDSGSGARDQSLPGDIGDLFDSATGGLP